jgi:hypothetical protein
MKYDSYRFRVSVYDSNLNNWSEFSEESEIINSTIGKLKNNLIEQSNIKVARFKTYRYQSVKLQNQNFKLIGISFQNILI